MGDVLLCCSEADRSRIDALVKTLIDEGHRVGWLHQLPAVLPRRTCLVAVWSRAVAGQGWFRRLCREAARRQRLVSLRLDDVALPFGLRRHAVVEMTTWPARSADAAVDALLAATARVLAASGGSEPSPRDPAWIVLPLVLAAVGAAIWFLGDAGTDGDGELAGTAERREELRPSRPAVAPTGDAVTPTSPEIEPVRPDPVVSADAWGAVALDGARTLLAGDAAANDVDAIRGAAGRALTLDPTQAEARLALGILRAGVDLDWQDARQLIDAATAAPTPATRALARRLSALYGDAIAGASQQEADSTVAPATACDLDDEGFVTAFLDGDPLARLDLLDEPCFLARVGSDPSLRRRLGVDHD